jgi:hypothetical protein
MPAVTHWEGLGPRRPDPAPAARSGSYLSAAFTADSNVS